MQQVQAGDVRLFEQLVRKYRPRLLRFALSKLHGRDAAEDVVQEACLAAYQARDSYFAEFAFSTWLWTILLNLSRRAQRQGARREEVWSGYAQTARERERPGDSPLARLLELERQEQCAAWLNQLPEEEADAIRLRFFGELKFDDIALAMDSSVSGAKVRVKRGLRRLAEIVRESL